MVYDDAQRLTRVYAEKPLGSGTILTSFSYCYQATPNPCGGADVGLRTAVTAQYPGAAATTSYYCYDGLNRLTSADGASAACPNGSAAYRYAYDASGNLTSKTVNGVTTSYTVNGANQLTNAGNGYDGDGSQTADPGVFSASYNALDQMSSVTPAGGTADALSYMGLGQARRVGNGSIGQVNDQLGLNEDTGPTNTFFTRDNTGTILGERRAGGAYYFLQDGLGSTAAVTDAGGNVVVSYSYDPYGATTCTPGGSACSFYEPIRYTGGYWDQNDPTDDPLYHFGQRYYDPTTARWTQIDPLDNPLDQHGWNKYIYAGDDPVNFTDPSGMCWNIFCHPIKAAKKTARAVWAHKEQIMFVGGAAVTCAIWGARAATAAAPLAVAGPEVVAATAAVGCALAVNAKLHAADYAKWKYNHG